MTGDDPRDNISLAVSNDDDWAFLELQAEESALTVEQVVVSLIRKARKAYEKPVQTVQNGLPDFDIMAAERERIREIAAEKARKRAELEAQLAALEEINVPDIPVAPDDFDEGLLAPEVAAVSLAGRPLAWKAPERALLRDPPSQNAPGALTAPAGINPSLKAGYVMGDHEGNVRRRAFKHLGADGGR